MRESILELEKLVYTKRELTHLGETYPLSGVIAKQAELIIAETNTIMLVPKVEPDA